MASVTAVHGEAGRPRPGRARSWSRSTPTAAAGPGVAGPRRPRAGPGGARAGRAQLPALPGAPETGSASELELDMARMQYEQAKGAVEQATGRGRGRRARWRGSRASSRRSPGASRRGWSRWATSPRPGRPLVMIESTAGRRLVLSVPESASPRPRALKVGDRAPGHARRAQPGAGRSPGSVVEMSPGADPATHTFTVKVDLCAASRSPPALRAGPPSPSGPPAGGAWSARGAVERAA